MRDEIKRQNTLRTTLYFATLHETSCRNIKILTRVMARRFSESSTDSWSLVERRSSVESSDEEEGEIVARDVYDEYDGESIGNDSMEDDTDFSESELEDEVEDAVKEEEASEEEIDGEVETILEEEALTDSAARHFVAAEKVVERLDELADAYDSPMEEALLSAVATPERMRLFVIIWLAITGAIVFGLERAFVANMNLITPQPSSESVQTGLPSREYLSRIGVAEVREFLSRRQLQRVPPRFVESLGYEKAFLKKVEERRERGELSFCGATYSNTTVSIRSPTSTWSQCSQADAPIIKTVPQFVQLPLQSLNKTTREFKSSAPRYVARGRPLQQLQPKMQLPLPCKSSVARPCKPTTPLRPTAAPRSIRPTKTSPIKPTTVPTHKYSTQKSPVLYRNYSVMRVYHDRSIRRDPKQSFLPSKSLITKKVAEEKDKQAAAVVDRMKKRRQQQKIAERKMNKRSVSPPVIYANASAAHSKALMRKSSFAAGHCDRRTVKDLRPLPCISYKERLPCLAPPPRRLLSTTAQAKKKTIPEKKNWMNTSNKARISPKKEYIRRIPLV